MKRTEELTDKIIYNEFTNFLKNQCFAGKDIKLVDKFNYYKLGESHFYCINLYKDYFLLLINEENVGAVYKYDLILMSRLSYIKEITIEEMKKIMTYEIKLRY